MSYQELLGRLQAKECKPNIPVIGPGDLLRVGVLIQEGNKSRIQPFQGTVLGIHSNQASTTLTLRRLAQVVNVERVLLLHSTKIATIQVLRRYKIRRSKLYYLRSFHSKKNRLKQKLS
uniref:ribosomal protein L19 n=1 Tax=Klebsormidium subtilissimum TaxID=184584 RepID=UPI00286BAC05|nr:ribosomal protein L19 [Klebsormidium subtilissimum]WKT08157.1 ribosomal protein L19 [Klebsormidium subtilissimum]